LEKIKESIILNIAFPSAELVMGTCAMKWYKKIAKMQSWTKHEISNWQHEELSKFIIHAYENTVYYKKVFDNLGIKPADIKSPSDLTKLPVITKEIINANYNDFVPKNLHQLKYRKSQTGGTTGVPLRYYCDEDTWGYITAVKIHSWQKIGYHYGDKFIALGSSSLFPEKRNIIRSIYDRMRAEIPLNGMNMSDDVCASYITFIKKNNINYLYGYASAIFLLSKYVLDNNLKIDLKAAFPTAEILTADYRETIIKAFNCRVMDCYGARDGGMTAYEVEPKKYYLGYNIIAEIVNPIGDNTGKLVTTNFLNYSFPLIRYDYGDEGTLENNYSGYNGQILTHIIGRSSDVFRLENGNNVTGPGFNSLLRLYDISSWCVKQLSGSSIEISIQPIKGKYTNEQEQEIRKVVTRYIGESCELKINHVESFETLKNGKRRYFLTNKD
jgi:phenylacetate-CoA ligase